jgi:hypothetical protein
LLDTVIKNSDIKSIDWIKIDTEGFEMEILKGSSQTIDKYKPSLFIEVDNNNLSRFGSGQSQLFSFLKSSGYQGYIAFNGHQIDFNTPVVPAHFDMIAIHKSKSISL